MVKSCTCGHCFTCELRELDERFDLPSERPRCLCGQFVSADPEKYRAHVRACPAWAKADDEEHEAIMAGWPR